jgi:Tol biopolymer transport system component
MFLDSTRTPSRGDYDIWVTHRPNTSAAWGAPTPVDALNTSSRDKNPSVRADGQMIVFNSNRPTTPALGQEIYKAYIDETGAAGPPALVAELGSTADESFPVLSSNGLAIYFARKIGTDDIYIATRASVADKFDTPTRIAELATTTADEHPSWVSADGCVLWFSSGDNTKAETYVAERGQ